jgi:hypothetical protein
MSTFPLCTCMGVSEYVYYNNCRIKYPIYLNRMIQINTIHSRVCDRLCGLGIRVAGYRSRGPGFNFRRYQMF